MSTLLVLIISKNRLKTSDLIEFFTEYEVPIAIDENLKLLKDVNFAGTTAAIIKPTKIGDFFTIKRLTSDFKKRGISPIFSPSFESQVGGLIEHIQQG